MYLPAQIDLLRRFFGAEYVDAEIRGLPEDSPVRLIVARRLLKERKGVLDQRKRAARRERHGSDKILTRSAITMPPDLREALIDAQRHTRICGRPCAALTLSHSHPLRVGLPLADDKRSLRVILDLRRWVPIDGRVMHEMVDAGDHIRMHMWVPRSAWEHIWVPDAADVVASPTEGEDMDFCDPKQAERIMVDSTTLAHDLVVDAMRRRLDEADSNPFIK